MVYLDPASFPEYLCGHEGEHCYNEAEEDQDGDNLGQRAADIAEGAADLPT